MPLVSIGLRLFEEEKGFTPYSLGSRRPVPPAQEEFWHEAAQAAEVGPLFRKLKDSFHVGGRNSWLLEKELMKPDKWKWKFGADHLEGWLQSVLMLPVEDMLNVLLVHLRWASGPSSAGVGSSLASDDDVSSDLSEPESESASRSAALRRLQEFPDQACTQCGLVVNFWSLVPRWSLVDGERVRGDHCPTCRKSRFGR